MSWNSAISSVIETRARRIRSDSSEMGSYALMLVDRPPFEPYVVEVLDRAEGELVTALERVRSVRERIKGLPVEGELLQAAE
jgi:hypothetical protein